MARIRSAKPGFLKHELLQELEEKHAALRPMLTYLGLWLVADKEGRFEWRPRQLHLEILPFLPYKTEEALALLQKHGFIRKYEVDGKPYGWIPTFKKHQRISGYECDMSPRCPEPQGDLGSAPEAEPKQTGSTPEAGQKQGRGGKPRTDPKDALLLPPELEAWFQAIWCDVWPDKVMRDNEWIKVDPGGKALARERFGEHAASIKPVALYLATRAYVKNHMKLKKGYVQEVSTFFGPRKATYKDYLEEVFPYLDAHPSLAALTAPPESEEAFRKIIAMDETP